MQCRNGTSSSALLPYAIVRAYSRQASSQQETKDDLANKLLSSCVVLASFRSGHGSCRQAEALKQRQCHSGWKKSNTGWASGIGKALQRFIIARNAAPKKPIKAFLPERSPFAKRAAGALQARAIGSIHSFQSTPQKKIISE